jgi:16S rRNA (adenine1518-N6/adenine1519-N6)-dimethyltransferase
MKLTSPSVLKEILSRHGFNFSKSLGQNFLINPSVCTRIAGQIPESDAKNTCVLEIGAGAGTLTYELAKHYKKVVSVETDRKLKPVLSETLAEFDNTEIVWGDVMELDLPGVFAEKFSGSSSVVCCANLPYYITSPVIMKLLELRLPLKTVTVMVQKEAAVRICAEPGIRLCGAISVAVNYYCKPEILFDVKRTSFFPVPNVDSCVICLDLTKRKKYNIINEKIFFAAVKAGFSERRKQIANPVSAAFGTDKSILGQKLREAGIPPSSRAEQLTMEQWADLSNCIWRENVNTGNRNIL